MSWMLRFLILLLQTPSSGIKTSFERVISPSWRAEFNGATHFHISPLVPKAEGKTFPKSRLLNLHLQTPWSTVKTSFEKIDTPIRCAELSDGVRFAVSLLVAKVEAKTFPKSRLLNLHLQTPWSTVKTSLKRVYTHIWYAESNGSVRFAVSRSVLSQ